MSDGLTFWRLAILIGARSTIRGDRWEPNTRLLINIVPFKRKLVSLKEFNKLSFRDSSRTNFIHRNSAREVWMGYDLRIVLDGLVSWRHFCYALGPRKWRSDRHLAQGRRRIDLVRCSVLACARQLVDSDLGHADNVSNIIILNQMLKICKLRQSRGDLLLSLPWQNHGTSLFHTFESSVGDFPCRTAV